MHAGSARLSGCPGGWLGCWLRSGLLAGLLAGAAAPAHANPALETGRQVFTGVQPLVAHMPGHPQALPAAAARCSNCHAAPGLPTARSGQLGPRLDASHLMQPQPRRGGPASRYDAVSLCRVLREGVDPAGVMLATGMPRYTLDDTTCRQLWTLLTSDLK